MVVGVESEMEKLVESLLVMVLPLMNWTKLVKHGINAEHALPWISNHVVPTTLLTKLVSTLLPSGLTVNGIQPIVL